MIARDEIQHLLFILSILFILSKEFFRRDQQDLQDGFTPLL